MGVGEAGVSVDNCSTCVDLPEADFEPKCLEQIISKLNPNQKNSLTQVQLK